MTQLVGSFNIGQIVVHRQFGYRGVIYDVDARFMLSEDWYERVALSRPPKESPWYHVLVDGVEQSTYVAERNLDLAIDPRPIHHPLVEDYFETFNGESYELRTRAN